MTERLLDAKGIADRLGVPESWVRESARTGAIPHVRLGRYIRFDLDDVEQWIESCKQPGRPVALRRYETRVKGRPVDNINNAAEAAEGGS